MSELLATIQTDLITASPETETLEAIEIMNRERIGCLPVVNSEGMLIGLVTETDFLAISKQLIEEKLKR